MGIKGRKYRINQPYANLPWDRAVSLGEVEGVIPWSKFGFNEAIGTAYEHIWQYGGDYTFSDGDSNPITHISSSSASDTQDLLIQGLQYVASSGLWVTYDQTVTLDGQNKKAITPICRVNRLFSDSAMVGDVYCYEDGTVVAGVPSDPTTIRGYIEAGKNQTLQSIVSVPSNSRTEFLSYDVNVGRNSGSLVGVQWCWQPRGGIDRIQYDHRWALPGPGPKHHYNPPRKLTGAGDIYWRGVSSQAGTQFSADFGLYVYLDEADKQ